MLYGHDDEDDYFPMSEHQLVIQSQAQNNDPSPEKCQCRGSGYWLSPFDSWHTCSFHWTPDQRHPEDYYPD